MKKSLSATANSLFVSLDRKNWHVEANVRAQVQRLDLAHFTNTVNGEGCEAGKPANCQKGLNIKQHFEIDSQSHQLPLIYT